MTYLTEHNNVYVDSVPLVNQWEYRKSCFNIDESKLLFNRILN